MIETEVESSSWTCIVWLIRLIIVHTSPYQMPKKSSLKDPCSRWTVASFHENSTGISILCCTETRKLYLSMRAYNVRSWNFSPHLSSEPTRRLNLITYNSETQNSGAGLWGELWVGKVLMSDSTAQCWVFWPGIIVQGSVRLWLIQ